MIGIKQLSSHQRRSLITFFEAPYTIPPPIIHKSNHIMQTFSNNLRSHNFPGAWPTVMQVDSHSLVCRMAANVCVSMSTPWARQPMKAATCHVQEMAIRSVVEIGQWTYMGPQVLLYPISDATATPWTGCWQAPMKTQLQILRFSMLMSLNLMTETATTSCL